MQSLPIQHKSLNFRRVQVSDTNTVRRSPSHCIATQGFNISVSAMHCIAHARLSQSLCQGNTMVQSVSRCTAAYTTSWTLSLPTLPLCCQSECGSLTPWACSKHMSNNNYYQQLLLIYLIIFQILNLLVHYKLLTYCLDMYFIMDLMFE